MDQNQTSSTANMDENQRSAVAVGWWLVVSLLMRFLTFIFLLVSLIVLVTDSTVESVDIFGFPVKATDFYAYRYMISAITIGMAYTLLLVVLTIFHTISASPIGGKRVAYFEFYSDKVISYLLATGAAAGLGFSVEYNRNLGIDFFNVANAAASLLLLGSFFSALSSVLSSLNLPKRS
ncbi:CASP-like protein PIMP1 [Nicotiana tabacum]|uniref:CASP-like protein n=1 Tax=Nicotiana tabacum TaxID=4097 RepID=A0A1S3ZSV6_TOBAC|nr:CASP-like protein PIMP1 [Nicotiana tomentosiformis]XP_016467490.1 PREDICTED: CASP-like protein PIMP1 [Nicotiana tabacum]